MSGNFFDNVSKVFATWDYDSPRILYGLARALKPQVICNVGTYRGLSAAWLAKACQENNSGIVVSLDDWSLTEHAQILNGQTPKEHCISNLEILGVKEWVKFNDGDTHDASIWPDHTDFVFIDAWHSFEACYNDAEKALERGATLVAFDDTENCVGPRLFVDHDDTLFSRNDWQQLDLHSDNGLTIFVKRKPRRLITFSQELPLPNPGVDLRPMSIAQQKAHFDEAAKITGLDYSRIAGQTEHDMTLP